MDTTRLASIQCKNGWLADAATLEVGLSGRNRQLTALSASIPYFELHDSRALLIWLGVFPY